MEETYAPEEYRDFQPASFSALGIDFDASNGALKALQGDHTVVPQGRNSNLKVEFHPFEKIVKKSTTEKDVKKIYLDYVKIYEPGRDYYTVDRKVRPQDMRKYPREWYLYKSGKAQNSGTPLSVMVSQGFLNQAHLNTLQYLGIQTVEALASMDDAALPSLGLDGEERRRYARGFLEYSSKIKTAVEKVATKERLEAIEKRLEAGALLSADTTDVVPEVEQAEEQPRFDVPEELMQKRRPGRPKKSVLPRQAGTA